LTGTKKIKVESGQRGHYNIQVTHGFRKWHNTTIKAIDGINSHLFEQMFSHTPQGIALDSVYNKPVDKVLFKEFEKYIPFLTLDKSESLILKNKRQESTQIEIVEVKSQLGRLERIIAEMIVEQQQKDWKDFIEEEQTNPKMNHIDWNKVKKEFESGKLLLDYNRKVISRVLPKQIN